MKEKNPLFLRYLGLVVVIIILDQLSKVSVLQCFYEGQQRMVTSYFQLVLVYNKGAAFSFLADHAGWQRWFLTVLAVLVSAFLLKWLKEQNGKLMSCALSLIIGGALGNVIDRIIHGAVVDFLYFHIQHYGWPAFNLADSAITLGVILLLGQQLFMINRKADK